MQFGGDDSHIRVPVTDNQTGDVVENQFDLDAKLCAGLCDAIFTITIRQKVELKDGKISKAAERKVVLDCRKTGDHSACGGAPGPGADIEIDDQLCGDVTKGEIALSGDVVLDAHLDAVRQLELIGDALDTQVTTALVEHGDHARPARGEHAPTTSRTALSMRLMQETQSGLTLLQGDQGCATRLSQVSVRSARVRSGRRRFAQDDRLHRRVRAARQRRLGLRGRREQRLPRHARSRQLRRQLRRRLPGRAGGARAVRRHMHRHRAHGTCPDDGMGGCAGPCDGDCTGTCRQTSTESCGGDCTGVCDLSASGAPMCEAPLAPYCSSASDAALACPGDCFGEAALTQGAAKCRASALAIGRILPRCAPPLVQLSFGFNMSLGADAQSRAGRSGAEAQRPARQAERRFGAARAVVGRGCGPGRRQSGRDRRSSWTCSSKANPKDKGIACAKTQLAAAGTWLDGEAAALADVQSKIDLIFAVVNIAQ